MRTIERLLIVENEPKDLLQAAETARAAGISAVEAKTSYESARTLLERGLRGELSLPDAIVLDLDLGHDSGHELLRFWYSSPGLTSIPMVVWSRLGEGQKEVCEAFRIRAFVSKCEGIAALRRVLEDIRKSSS